MSDLQQQADAIYGRPTVTVPLAEYDRLRRLEDRANAVVRMLTLDLELIKTGQLKASAQATRFALSFARGVLEDVR